MMEDLVARALMSSGRDRFYEEHPEFTERYCAWESVSKNWWESVYARATAAWLVEALKSDEPRDRLLLYSSMKDQFHRDTVQREDVSNGELLSAVFFELIRVSGRLVARTSDGSKLAVQRQNFGPISQFARTPASDFRCPTGFDSMHRLECDHPESEERRGTQFRLLSEAELVKELTATSLEVLERMDSIRAGEEPRPYAQSSNTAPGYEPLKSSYSELLAFWIRLPSRGQIDWCLENCGYLTFEDRTARTVDGYV